MWVYYYLQWVDLLRISSPLLGIILEFAPPVIAM